METEVPRPDEIASDTTVDPGAAASADADQGDEAGAGDAVAAGEEDDATSLGDAATHPEETPELGAVLEGMLFAAGAPVALARLAEAVDGADRGEVRRALRALAEQFEADGRGLRLVEVAGGFQLRTLPEHAHYVRRLLGGRPPRLSRAMLETLAIIAYKQPCTRPEIEAIRGVDVDAVVSTLLERRMIRLLGRKEAPGRPLLYGTTREFLEVFGLPDLEALPPLRDLGEIAAVLTETDLSVSETGVHPTRGAVTEAASGTTGDFLREPPEARGEASEDDGQPEPE
jgi:segregation and condensation protein B